MDERTAVCAAILAGGAATRLGGRDKGLERFGGRPLVAWVVDALRAQVVELSIVANRNHEAYRNHATTIADALPGFRGPLAGIAAALAASAAPWLLTVPVDCPTPPPDLARRLLAVAAPGTTRGPAFVAHDGVRREPLFALYGPGLAESAARAARAGLGPRRWQDEIGAIEVDFADRRTHFTNLNEPADFIAFPLVQRGEKRYVARRR
jgi:molybdenum cofactor guanylyltransferase